MKIRLLDIHIYLNLLCAGYMLLYGVSALCFNHNVEVTDRQGRVWETTIVVPPGDEDQLVAEAVRDQLDLFGWVPFWRHSHPHTDQHVFFIDRPSRQYRIHLNSTTGTVRVQETNRGLLGTIKGLHGLKNLPNSRWGVTWSIFTEISIVALAFSVGSGFWFWWLRSASRCWGWWLIGVGCGGSLLLMFSLIV